MMHNPDTVFHYSESLLGKITGPLDPRDPTGPSNGLAQAGVVSMDGRGQWTNGVVCMPYGILRLPRSNQSALIHFPFGFHQWPVIMGHALNTEALDGPYPDPMPSPFAMLDDFVIYHDETEAFLRFRNLWSVAATGTKKAAAGPDGSPGEVELKLASGIDLVFSDYAVGPPVTSNPPEPVRGKVSLTMPSSATVVIDEPAQGQATIAVTLPSGVQITVDAQGNVIVSSPKTIQLLSPDCESGANSNAADTNKVALKSDLTALKTYIDAHTHSGVQTGSGTSGPPVSPSPSPTCAQKSFAS